MKNRTSFRFTPIFLLPLFIFIADPLIVMGLPMEDVAKVSEELEELALGNSGEFFTPSSHSNIPTSSSSERSVSSQTIALSYDELVQALEQERASSEELKVLLQEKTTELKKTKKALKQVLEKQQQQEEDQLTTLSLFGNVGQTMVEQIKEYEIENQQLEYELEQARVDLKAARAEIEKLKNGERTENSSLGK